MRRFACLMLGSALSLSTTANWGYEDQTHQALTRRAVRIAAQNGVPEGFFSQVQVQGIIDGAGKHKLGEDYTRYDIKGICPVYVEKYNVSSECFTHFATGLLWADPAWVRFLTFWHDAVDLWRKGNRYEAAFILGRAVHLVEDMAAPQHAMADRSVCPTVWNLPYGLEASAADRSVRATQEMEVQPQGDTETGRFAVEATRSKRQSSARRSCRGGRKLIAGRQGDV